jgi:hypothetical protein
MKRATFADEPFRSSSQSSAPGLSQEPPNDRREIQRIRNRAALALTLLIGFWVAICVFVLVAMWRKWEM